jgi:hypothetical protein
MIRHQAVGMQRAIESCECPAKVKEIEAAIVLSDETRYSIVTALDDVQREPGDY